MGHGVYGQACRTTTTESRDRLHALNIEYRGHVEIHTLDRFLTMAESAIGFGPIGIPTQALTMLTFEEACHVHSRDGSARTLAA